MAPGLERWICHPRDWEGPGRPGSGGGGGPLDVPVGCVRRQVVGCVVAELLGEAGNRTQPLSLQLFLRAWILDMPSYRA